MLLYYTTILDWRSPSFLAKSGALVKIKNKTTKKIEIGVNALYGTLLVLFVYLSPGVPRGALSSVSFSADFSGTRNGLHRKGVTTCGLILDM